MYTNITKMNDFFIGGFSAIVARTATAPLELTKLQMQNNYLNNNVFNVIRNEGVRHLWKGNFTNCIRTFPQYAINFAVYEKAKNVYKHVIFNNSSLHLLSGLTSGAISMVAIYPLETARTHLGLQTNNSNYNGLLDVFKKLSMRELYAGLRMSIFGFAPWNAINFASYNFYKETFIQYKENKNVYKLLCGGFAGITAISVTYPTDLIRKRLQMQSFSLDVPRYSGIFDCVEKIVKQEGIIGLYRGLSISYVKSFPTLAIQFWAYDTLKELVEK